MYRYRRLRSDDCMGAVFQVEVSHRKGQMVNSSWGTDKSGKATDDPEKIISEGGLFPLGGPEITSRFTAMTSRQHSAACYPLPVYFHLLPLYLSCSSISNFDMNLLSPPLSFLSFCHLSSLPLPPTAMISRAPHVCTGHPMTDVPAIYQVGTRAMVLACWSRYCVASRQMRTMAGISSHGVRFLGQPNW